MVHRQLDTAQWRGMSMYLYEPDSFTPLARLEQTLEEPAHITLGPDGEFTEHPVKTTHATYFYQNDHLGTPQELVDEEGEIVWLGKYRAWGELRSATQQNGQPSQIRNALRFQGQYCDDETGLHYNLNRYYDPASGRFINKDPIGLKGGFNLYTYVVNPTEWIDPLGLDPVTFTDSGGMTLTASGYTDLNHLSTSDLNTLVFMNGPDAPDAWGRSPVDKKGNTIDLHHYQQQDEGPVIAMPQCQHRKNSGKLHTKGCKLKDRDRFNQWKKEFWTNQASTALKVRGEI